MVWTMGLVIAAVFTILATVSGNTLRSEAAWKSDWRGWWYTDNSARGYKTGWQVIDGKMYYFDQSGWMKTGWQKMNGYWYYFGSDGAARRGWTTVGTTTYYLDTKYRMLTGLQTIGNARYYFDASGALQKNGWLRYGRYWLYLNKNGSLYSGWLNLNGKTYFLNKSGVMVTGRVGNYYFNSNGELLKNTWIRISNKYYYAGKNGVIQTGWLTLNGKTYYLRSDGEMQVGTMWLSGKRYFFYSNGAMATGWVKVKNGSYYYFYPDGHTAIGLNTISGKTYYMNASGVMQTGWQKIKGGYYYFESDGSMAKNKWIQGVYYVGSDGKRLTNTKAPDGTEIGADGKAKQKKILIIAGHGYGDPGATSKWGYESNYTRELATLVQRALIGSGMSVEMYDQNRNCYYDVANGISEPDWDAYSYILEIHFNAKTSKDEDGDGSFTGVGGYVHPGKTNRSVENRIISNIVNLGFKYWAMCTSTGLCNLRHAYEAGGNYFLLETAFIDDGDDMRFYTNNKTKFENAIASALVSELKYK